jgi:DHA1 family tetracycline resistance protein-like MFS transporter
MAKAVEGVRLGMLRDPAKGPAVVMLAMGFAPTGLLFALAIVPNSLWGLAEPTIKSLMSARVAEDEQGRLQGASRSLASLAGIIGPLFFGWIYAATLADAPWLAFAIGALVPVIAAAATMRVWPAPAFQQ